MEMSAYAEMNFEVTVFGELEKSVKDRCIFIAAKGFFEAIKEKVRIEIDYNDLTVKMLMKDDVSNFAKNMILLQSAIMCANKSMKEKNAGMLWNGTIKVKGSVSLESWGVGLGESIIEDSENIYQMINNKICENGQWLSYCEKAAKENDFCK